MTPSDPPEAAATAFPKGAVDVESAEGEAAALATLADERELAVDVEADAMHAFRARLCYVQVGTDRDVFLFDTLHPEVDAAALNPLFSDEKRTKFFHAAGEDLKYLAERGVRVQGLFDTHRAATLLGWPKVGLSDLARDLLGVELLKEHQQSDFSIRPLPPPVRAYIADDVRYLCAIGRAVQNACARADIFEEVRIDCQRMCDEAKAPPSTVALKVKLPRAGLSKEQLAIAEAAAKELHRCRLAWAEAQNLPMGMVLSNASIVAIAVAATTGATETRRDLSKLHGMRERFLREHADEVLALLRQVRDKVREQSARGELQRDDDGHDKPDPGRKKREDALKALRQDESRKRSVTPSVVLPNSLVDELARTPPRSLDELALVPYFGEKRLRLYGAQIIARLAGLPSVAQGELHGITEG